jgi:N-acetylmuramoyl-L-alanine amidase
MKNWVSICIRCTADTFLIVTALAVCLGSPALADRKTEAREQFEHAVKMRTMLEGYLPRDRALDDYKQTIAAYQKVYLISTQAPEVTPSLIAEAELYREMGRLFDQKYFQTAVNMYEFLLSQYPQTRYRGEILFAIGEVQKDDQNNLDAAEATFKEFLKRYPQNEKAGEARAALSEIASEREKSAAQVAGATTSPKSEEISASGLGREGAVEAGPRAARNSAVEDASELGPILEPRDPSKAWTSVKSIDASNANDHTRIIVKLDDTVKYEAAHLHSPDRIYFDLHRARVGSKIAGKTINFQSGLLKSVRVGQNRPDVVRIVLDATSAKDYSAVLVGKPYRLIIDLRSETTAGSSVASKEPTNATPPVSATPSAGKPAETISVNTEKTAAPESTTASPAVAEKAAVSIARPPSIKTAGSAAAVLKPPPEARPTRDGQRSLTRTLDLKIGRIVIDPGHGGHDTGTIGPHGLMEKDLCLDVALRLGHIIEQKLPGAEVVYTRKDDTFVPLEQRTAIANEAKADLFISIHANSSRDREARGVETYYLNFANSAESMEVATRENAYSEKSLHDLQDLIQKIARNEKMEESKELANDIQDALSHRLQLVSAAEHNRGVKRAPFIVLIGANMPSVLAEISFVSNPTDERMLRKPEQRERIANGLYRGIAAYLESLNSLSYNKPKYASDARTGAADANHTTIGQGPRTEQ